MTGRKAWDSTAYTGCISNKWAWPQWLVAPRGPSVCGSPTSPTHARCGCLSDMISRGPHDRSWWCGLPGFWTSFLGLWKCWWEAASARRLYPVKIPMPDHCLQDFSDPCRARAGCRTSRECPGRCRALPALQQPSTSVQQELMGKHPSSFVHQWDNFESMVYTVSQSSPAGLSSNCPQR